MAAEVKAAQLVDVDELIARLEARGVPQGTWLVEIAQVRAALRKADDVMIHMQSAITRSFEVGDEVGV